MLGECMLNKKAVLELLLAILALCICCCGLETPSPPRSTEFRELDNAADGGTLSRSKRYLLWNPLSVVQITVALAIPMREVRQRSMAAGVAFDIQGNYPLPTKIEQLRPGYIPVAAGSRRIVRDLTLQDAYLSFEDLLYGQGFEGRACLLQAICMVAEIPISRDNLHEELIHLFLSPLEISSGVASHYKEAQDLGESGADCRKAFSECKTPILDVISRIWKLDSPINDPSLEPSSAHFDKIDKRSSSRNR